MSVERVGYARITPYLTGYAPGKKVAITREEKKRMTTNPGFIMVRRGKEVRTTWAIATHEPKAVIETSTRRWHGCEVGGSGRKDGREEMMSGLLREKCLGNETSGAGK